MNGNTLTVAPMQRASVVNLSECNPLNKGDSACLAEIQEVLKKYGKHERFGVTLLHQSLSLAEDEVLMEYTDRAGRELTIKPIKRGTVSNPIETSWILCDGEPRAMRDCFRYCAPNVHGNHDSFHR